MSVGPDGTVWGVNSTGAIFRRDEEKWIQIPGQLTQLSVASKLLVWGVNRAGNIFQHS